MGTKKKRYVIVRCTAAGVHAGELVSVSGDTVVLRQSRRLWLWRVPLRCGSFLSGVALHGLGELCKVGEPVDVKLIGACEVITCSDVAEHSIRGYAVTPRTM